MALSRWSDRLKSVFGGTPEPPAEQAKALTRQGVAHLDAGEYAQACTAFRRATEIEPEVAAHQVNLAYALQQTGAHELALLNLQRAVALDPDNVDAHFMLAGALERDGEFGDAITHYRSAIRLKPGFVPAYAGLGRSFAASDDKRAARETFTAGLALDPSDVQLLLYMGNVCMEMEDGVEARKHYEKAASLAPGNPEVLANLGRALRACKDLDASLRSFDEALRLKPDAAPLHMHRGVTLRVMNRLQEALVAMQYATDIDPEDAEAHNMLGTALAQAGRLDEAIREYERAIELRPELPGAYGNLGLALYEQGRVVDAVAFYRKGLEIKSVAEIHDNLGIALQKLGAPDEAIEHYRKALELQPDNVNTQCNLAVALAGNDGYAEGIRAHRKVIEFRPDHLNAYSNLLHYLSVDASVSAEEYLAEAARFDAQLTKHPLPPRPSKQTGGPLRVGLVSGDLRAHPVGYFIEGLVQQLASHHIELYGYPTTAVADGLTARIRPHFAGWRTLKGLSDEDAARVVRDDGIDILIDLAGHTGDNRLPVFAWRPAPLQITWLGFWASTGISAIDVILVDALCVPPGAEEQFTERVWRLPKTRMCFTPPAPDAMPAVSALPALARGHVTFGCFQRMPKINDAVLALWARVMAEVPDARLLIQSEPAGRPVYAERLRNRILAAGIELTRVEIRGAAPRATYLHSYAEVDLVLDTFPFTGGTTTCEALWMGVPTLTRAGHNMISRQGPSMMTLAGLSDWVARDDDDFVRLARHWATHPERLATIRAELRDRLPDTPLFDTTSFARDFAAAMHELWQAHALQRDPSIVSV